MMETIRKGMWQASGQQIADIAKLHTDLVNKYKPSCSGFVCDNAKLRQFIVSKTDAQTLHPGIRKTSVRYVKLLLQKSKRVW